MLKDDIIAALQDRLRPGDAGQHLRSGAGLRRRRRTPPGAATVRMTLTAPNCPVAGSLPGEVERRVRAVPGVTDVKVELTFDPPWTPERMSSGRQMTLGLDDVHAHAAG